MMPKIDRPGSSGGAGRGAREAGAASRRPSRSSPARAPKSPRRRGPSKQDHPLLLVAWLVFLIAVPLWAWSTIEKVDIEPNGARPGRAARQRTTSWSAPTAARG